MREQKSCMHTGEFFFKITICKINLAVALLMLFFFKFYLLVCISIFIIYCRHVDIKYMCCVFKKMQKTTTGPEL